MIYPIGWPTPSSCRMHTVSQVLWSLIEMADWSWHYPATNDEKQNDSLTTQQGSDHHAPVHSHSLQFVRDSPRPFIEDFGTDRVVFEPWEPLDHRQAIENSKYILLFSAVSNLFDRKRAKRNSACFNLQNCLRWTGHCQGLATNVQAMMLGVWW